MNKLKGLITTALLLFTITFSKAQIKSVDIGMEGGLASTSFRGNDLIESFRNSHSQKSPEIHPVRSPRVSKIIQEYGKYQISFFY